MLPTAPPKRASYAALAKVSHGDEYMKNKIGIHMRLTDGDSESRELYHDTIVPSSLLAVSC